MVRSLPMPILLLWGRSDRILPREHLEFYRGSLPAHAVIEEPEGFGHSPYLDDAAALSERMARFIAS